MASKNPVQFVERVPRDRDHRTQGYFPAKEGEEEGKSLGAERNNEMKMIIKSELRTHKLNILTHAFGQGTLNRGSVG